MTVLPAIRQTSNCVADLFKYFNTETTLNQLQEKDGERKREKENVSERMALSDYHLHT